MSPHDSSLRPLHFPTTDLKGDKSITKCDYRILKLHSFNTVQNIHFNKFLFLTIILYKNTINAVHTQDSFLPLTSGSASWHTKGLRIVFRTSSHITDLGTSPLIIRVLNKTTLLYSLHICNSLKILSLQMYVCVCVGCMCVSKRVHDH